MSRKKKEPLQLTGRMKRDIDSTVLEINTIYERNLRELGNLSPLKEEDRKRAAAFFQAKTEELRKLIQTYIARGYSEEDALKRVLPEAYAAVKAASKFLWNKPHYDVQLIGGILLNDGYVSQMATGEGKTLTATLPAYLNALLGKGVQVITPNGYLAARDQREMSELYNLMGLTCSLINESRNVSKEEVTELATQILNAQFQKSVTGIKNKALIDKRRSIFFNNPTILLNARREAFTYLKKKKALERKKAYLADIIYGSSSAIAFDYLYDDLETDPDFMVQRPGKPNFAIIDEVDAVLFEDARTPFNISGRQEDELLAITDEDQLEAKRRMDQANRAIFRIFLEDKHMASIRPGASILHFYSNKQDYDKFLKEAPYEDELQRTKALIFDAQTKRYEITPLGDVIIFMQYRASQLQALIQKYQKEIVEGFKEGRDFEYTKDHRLLLSPRTVLDLVESDDFIEFKRLYEDYQMHEMIDTHQEIDNAIRAWFLLERGKDYDLVQEGNEFSVQVIKDGRTAKGRVYSNGLHQAVERKEQSLRQQIRIKETPLSNTLASIPTASFFERYEKVGGMTGTAAINAFKNLYGLETYEVPRNIPKAVTDHGERLYPDTDSKFEAIFQEAYRSYLKKQPVLISTTSKNKSEMLYQFLSRRFQQEGILISIPVLNAEIQDIEQESKIVAKAGMPGQITICTEMAGRGTDIKLGGEVPSPEELMQQLKISRVEEAMQALRAKGKITPQNEAAMRAKLNEIFDVNKGLLESEVLSYHRNLMKMKAEMEKQILDANGLKIIGSGHFQFSRVDDQVKGRCGRQGNVGEVIFFSDPSDLEELGIPKAFTQKLLAVQGGKPIEETPDMHRTPLSDCIYEAQTRFESATFDSIKYEQETARAIAHYRNEFREEKDSIKRSKNYTESVEAMVQKTAQAIVIDSAPYFQEFVESSRKLSRKSLDVEEFISLCDEFLGVKMTESEILACGTIGDLTSLLTDKSIERFYRLVEEKGQDQLEEEAKKIVDIHINRAWSEFEGYMEALEAQKRINAVSKYNVKIDIPSQVAIAFHHAIESQRAMMVREILHPEYRKKIANPRTELIPVRVLASGLTTVSRDFDQKLAADMEEERRRVQEWTDGDSPKAK